MGHKHCPNCDFINSQIFLCTIPLSTSTKRNGGPGLGLGFGPFFPWLSTTIPPPNLCLLSRKPKQTTIARTKLFPNQVGEKTSAIQREKYRIVLGVGWLVDKGIPGRHGPHTHTQNTHKHTPSIFFFAALLPEKKPELHANRVNLCILESKASFVSENCGGCLPFRLESEWVVFFSTKKALTHNRLPRVLREMCVTFVVFLSGVF